MLDGGEVSTLTDALGNYRFAGLLPGSYTVAEVQRDGWVQTKPLPNAVSVGVSTANSAIQLEADFADEGILATDTGPAVMDFGKLAMDTALQSTAITGLRQQAAASGITLDGRGTTTVVIDTGIDLDHSFFGPDLNGDGIADRIVYQHDFANNDNDATDYNGHGSHIASLIGSQDSLYAGVAPGTDLIALKVFEDSGRGTFAYLEKALQWVLANHEAYHIGVVNMSLGDNGNWTDQFSRYGIGDELAALAQTDVIVVAAAGNNYLQFGKMGVAYPASDPAAIAVGATWAANFGGPWTVSTGATNYSTGADQIAAFSQRSSDLIDTFAPGARLNGANANGGTATMQGTSQAAAFVSGAAALAQQIAHQTLGRGLSTGEFATLLRSTGDLIIDGDDEVDNVTNTGAKFPRLDMVKLAGAIVKLKDAPAGSGNGGSTGTPTVPLAQQAASGVHNAQLAAGTDLSGQDFGNFQLGKASGLIYGDLDRSGSVGNSEQGLAGLTVYLDDNNNGSLDAGERSTTTGTDGMFSFDALRAGSSTVRVVAPAGNLPTVPASLQINITSGANLSGLNIGLAPANHAPTAGDDSYSAHAGQVLTVAAPGLLGNDSDVDGDTLTVTASDANGTQGTVHTFADGRFDFTPTTGFTGQTHFSYTVSDGLGGQGTATVTINVLATPPVARDDSATLDEDGTVRIDVLANDTTAGTTTLTLGTASHGTVSLTNDGRVLYAPTANFFGDDLFSYAVIDSNGGPSSAVVHVHVNPVNDAPTLGAVANQGVAEGSTFGYDLSASDVDDSSLTFSLLQGPAGATLDAHSGHLSWLAGSDTAAQTFRVQVADPAGLTDTRQFSVQVQLGKLVATSFAATAWGFALRLNDVIATAPLNLYGAAAPDVTVTGSATGVVKGSLVMDDDGRGFSFIRSGPQLAADRYTVVVRGANDGVVNTRRGALDGDANGTAGGNYSASFTVAAPPAVRLRLPDFARGPGQDVNVPNTGLGLPVTLASDGTVKTLTLRLRADVDTLTISEIRRGADLPPDATLTVLPVAGQPGQFDIRISRATALPVGTLKLLALIGSVPQGAQPGDAGAVVLDAVTVNGVAAPLAGDAAVDLVAYPGDVDFSGTYTAADASAVGRIATGAMTSLPQNLRVDVALIGDVDSNGVVNALDTAQVLARSRSAATATIPAVPVIPALPASLPASVPVLLADAVSLPASLNSASASGGLSTAGAGWATTAAAGKTPINLGGSFSNFALSPASSPVLPDAGLRIVPSVVSAG